MEIGWTSAEGSPFPLGLSWVETESAYNFALYSKHAHRVSLLFYKPGDLQNPTFRFDFDHLKNKSGPIWHCRISREQLGLARYYAYRVSGPDPGPGFAWHNFDPEKLLLDPYATAVFFPPRFDRSAAIGPGSNVEKAPLAVLQDVRCECEFNWGGDALVRHESDLVIYEMHVRGFTRHGSSGVSEQTRGTFAGVIEKIPHLRELGVTAVELMPVFQYDPGDGNYWGYMPLNFFAPHHAYSRDPASCHQHNEFREMVRELHAADIEVILDVVFNHTAEGDDTGPTYSFKGIDNSTYYMLAEDRSQPYANFSGTGNTLHTRNRAVRQIIIDSLRYWVTECHVDGFRFDLASIFARNPDGSVSPDDPPIFGEIAAHPELANIRLLAEPWDASGLFQLGRHFPGNLWMQWNSGYRDTLQRFVRGDPAMVGDLMSRAYGSADFFPDDLPHAFHPFQSINYITSHDGSTLYDLTAYNQKNNWANGHGNTDGANEYSWNCGWEGDHGVPEQIRELRKQQVKNFFCLLMLSNGTPMFRMGDEFLNTQNGNNNPYNQDNETSWLDWNGLESNRDIFRFFTLMIAFRKTHPTISRSRFWRGGVRWHGTSRITDLSPSSRQVSWHLGANGFGDEDLYVMINAAPEDLAFGIHEGSAGEWRRIIDTSLPSPEDIAEPGVGKIVTQAGYLVQGHSVVVLTRSARGTTSSDPQMLRAHGV